MSRRLLISGGEGRFAREIIKNNSEYEIYAPSKSEMDICDIHSIRRAVYKFNPDIFLHPAGLTRPMVKHVEDPEASIMLNIIGTSNACLACIERGKKIVYISTDYVYPGTIGNYSEGDAVLPVNRYAWSKLGGECAVKLYDNSLILRVCMTERPFVHPKALVDAQKSLMYIDEAAKVCLKVMDQTGIINIGGEPTTLYDFAKQERSDIKKIYRRDIKDVAMAKDSTMNIQKLRSILG